MSTGTDKWDYKHGLHGRARGADYQPQGGATHSGLAADANQIKERIKELFGKSSDTDRKRLMGIPTHFDQLQGLLKNFASTASAEGRTSQEQDLIDTLNNTVTSTTLSYIPPMGLVFPGKKQVWIMSKRQGNASLIFGAGFQESELAATYAYWKIDRNTIGDFRKLYPDYKAWSFFQNSGTVQANLDANYSLVGNFFGDGLQEDAE